MNVIDKFYSFFDPKRAYERMLWRQEMDAARNYDSGGFGRINSNWRVLNESGEFTDRFQRDTIRARARDLERNSDMANALVYAFKRNVVGRGFRLQAKTEDSDINRQLEALWVKWCRRRNCDVTGTQNFSQMLRMAVERKKVDGGLIFLKRYTNGGLLPFKLQALEVDELAKDQMTPKHKDNRVVGGIEYNRFNRAMGYWIQEYSIDGMTPMVAQYIPAKDVIFYWTKKRPSQVREISDMAHTITRVRDANEFINAISVKERIAACLSVFITRNPQQGGPGIGRNGAAQGKEGRIEYAGKTLSPGMITEMATGDGIQVVNPGSTATDADSFLKSQQRLMASGMGLGYEATSRDMSNSNYSSARQGAAEDSLTYDEERELLIEAVMDEVYESFVISAFLAGLVTAPDFWDHKEDYIAHNWVAQPKPWIDPAKEATANKIALATGQKTFQQICAEAGRDWKEVIDEMAEAIEYATDKNIELGGILYGNAKQTPPANPPAATPDDE